jgi:dihydrodipicolinate synthase/N-acetylneuraminate lyase
MTKSKLPRHLSGVVPPMLTPLSARDTLDVAGLEKLVEHIITGGVNGLFLLGTTGEGTSLSYRLRRELVERTCGLARGRLPVLVTITDTAFVESVALAQYAAQCGADALVLAPPYYLPEGQPELREYLGHLLPELPLPLFIYNMPPLTKVPYDLETVRWAMDQPGIVGLKDSSGDMIYFNQLIELRRSRPDWTLFVGPEELIADAVLMGGDGGVPGGGNLFPRLYVDLVLASQAGDLAKAKELQNLVRQVVAALYRIGKHPSTIIKGIKCAASCLDLCQDFMAEPFHRFRTAERELVQQRLNRLCTEALPARYTARQKSS